jgi:cobalt-zinc-cadmium efflux system protein
MSQAEHHPEVEHRHRDYRDSSRRRLGVALALTVGYMVAEIVGGLWADSLALIADAAHMLGDVAALGLALFAIWVAGRPATIKRTFGFQRTEVLAALINALSLWIFVGFLFHRAYLRLLTPPEVEGLLVLGVGGGGLLINIVVAWVLHRSAAESLNVEGAFIHVLGDLLGSIGVVAAGALIFAFGWHILDPIFSIIIGLLILTSSARLLWKVSHVLMEGTPSYLDLHRLCQRLEAVEGVTGVHDIHAWSITTGYDAFSAHVTTYPQALDSSAAMLQRLRDIASREFGISHVTIQLEDAPLWCTEDHHIEHPNGALTGHNLERGSA